MTVYLTPEEQAILDGAEGPAARKAMEIVVTLGRIYNADRLVPVSTVQVAGVSYRNLGDAGLEFLRDWAREGARVRVPTTLNPAGMDMIAWREMGISAEFAARQVEAVEAYTSMGIQPTCTCTPYLVGSAPDYAEHLAWSESSAVCYANSVLGARTNREGGPSALAAAICGRTAAYGLHRDEARRATHRVRVECPVREPWEFAALGYWVGRQVGNGIPYVEGLDLPPALVAAERAGRGGEAPAHDALKLMGAALASSGAVALFHVEGVTPEARLRNDVLPTGVQEIEVRSLGPAIEALNHPVETIDLVVIGCPHASLDEIRAVAGLVRGRRLASALWVTTSRGVREQAQAEGLVDEIAHAGGRVVADGCVVVAPMRELPYRTLATNSAKMASYALSHAGLQVRFGSLQECLEAAIRGKWEAGVH